MRKLSKAELKVQRQEFVSGITGTAKQEVHVTQFELLLARLGLTEATCHLNEEVAAWCNRYKNFKFIPEMVLHRLSMDTEYDAEPASWSIVDGVVLPEPTPLEEVDSDVAA
jgi:hypothetical protein